MKQDTKDRLSLRLSPLTSYRLHTAYKSAGFRSMNELAEQAITFYLDTWRSETPEIFFRWR